MGDEYVSGVMCKPLISMGYTKDFCMRNIFGLEWVPELPDNDHTIVPYHLLVECLHVDVVEESEIVEPHLVQRRREIMRAKVHRTNNGLDSSKA